MNIQTFQNDEIGNIRGLLKDGEPWFLAGSVCRALGVKDSSKVVRDIEKHYKDARVRVPTSSRILVDTKGGKQWATIIPEHMLYAIVFRSRKKKAVTFQAWVLNEVIPSIRKHGHYRQEGILVRKQETDAIAEFVEYAKSLGSTKPEMYYIHFTKLANSLMNINPGQRDNLTPEQLEDLALAERIIERNIKRCINEGLPYKECYREIKRRTDQFPLLATATPHQ